MVKASHTIDLGRSYLNPYTLIFTDSAKNILATNQKLFKQSFGTHFVAGTIMKCGIDIYLKKFCKDTDDKLSIAASIEASYKTPVASVGGKIGGSYDKNNT